MSLHKIYEDYYGQPSEAGFPLFEEMFQNTPDIKLALPPVFVEIIESFGEVETVSEVIEFYLHVYSQLTTEYDNWTYMFEIIRYCIKNKKHEHLKPLLIIMEKYEDERFRDSVDCDVDGGEIVWCGGNIREWSQIMSDLIYVPREVEEMIKTASKEYYNIHRSW